MLQCGIRSVLSCGLAKLLCPHELSSLAPAGYSATIRPRSARYIDRQPMIPRFDEMSRTALLHPPDGNDAVSPLGATSSPPLAHRGHNRRIALQPSPTTTFWIAAAQEFHGCSTSCLDARRSRLWARTRSRPNQQPPDPRIAVPEVCQKDSHERHRQKKTILSSLSVIKPTH